MKKWLRNTAIKNITKLAAIFWMPTILFLSNAIFRGTFHSFRREINLLGLGLLCRTIKYSHILYYFVANISSVFIRSYVLLLVRKCCGFFFFFLLDCSNSHLWSAFYWKIKQLSPFLRLPSRLLVKLTTEAIFYYVNMCCTPQMSVIVLLSESKPTLLERFAAPKYE